MRSLIELGLSPAQAIDLMTFTELAASSDPLSKGPSTLLEGYFDASDRSEGGDVIVWWNDLEKDSRLVRLVQRSYLKNDSSCPIRYARWSTALSGVRVNRVHHSILFY